jgi:hypothetical protein
MDAEAILKKLRWSPEKEGLLINAPKNLCDTVFALRSYNTVWDKAHHQKYDIVLIFGEQKAELERHCVFNSMAGKFDALFWACYPKGTGKIKSDLKREVVWDILSLIGQEAVSQIAIDETWSALRGRPPQMVGKK